MKTLSFLLFFSFTSFLACAQVPKGSISDTTKSQIFDSVDVQAVFPGGVEALRKFLVDNINMDSIVKFSDKEMHNKVIVRFVVNKDGDVERAAIDRASTYCPPCNKEALRLVESIP
jgi:protein TonB